MYINMKECSIELRKIIKKYGFTLTEIIVVLIVLGVLVSIALPNLISVIEKSRTAEAISNIEAIKNTMDGCGMKNGTYSTCDLSNVGYMSSNGGAFTYSIASGAGDQFCSNLGAGQTGPAICLPYNADTSKIYAVISSRQIGGATKYLIMGHGIRPQINDSNQTYDIGVVTNDDNVYWAASDVYKGVV